MQHDHHPIDRAAMAAGGRVRLADTLNVTVAAISNWKARGVPIQHCAAIERISGGTVTRQELRPDDWQRIWPELAASDIEPAAAGEEV